METFIEVSGDIIEFNTPKEAHKAWHELKLVHPDSYMALVCNGSRRAEINKPVEREPTPFALYCDS